MVIGWWYELSCVLCREGVVYMGLYYANLSFVEFRTVILGISCVRQLIKPNVVYKDTKGMTNHMIKHYYAHHQEHTTKMLITTLVVSFLVCCRLEVSCG